MPTPFATTAELQDGWRPLTDAEASRASVLLDRASRFIRSRRKGIDALITAGDLDPDLVGDIACAMVKRVMQGPVDLDGVSARTEAGGPFSQTVTFANPSGDLYLTKAEKVSLGIAGLRAASVDLIPSDA